MRELIAYARTKDARWSWKLRMRPETAALLGLQDGEVEYPDPRYGPLEVKRFDGCEVAVIDLVADVVLANPVDDYGFTPNVADAETYWLHLDTGKLDVWTADSLTELEP